MRLPGVPRRFPSRSPMRQVWSTAVALAAIAIALGVTFVTSRQATATAAWDPVKEAFPMWVWGCVFIAMGAAILVVLVVPRTTRPATVVLVVTGMVHVGYACLFVQAWISKHAGLVGVIFWCGLAAFHFILMQAAAKRDHGGLYSRPPA